MSTEIDLILDKKSLCILQNTLVLQKFWEKPCSGKGGKKGTFTVYQEVLTEQMSFTIKCEVWVPVKV